MTTRTVPPHLYLDTNVILDVLDNRWQASTDLMRRIAVGGWRCSTSRFTFLEMLDVKQENRFVQNRLAEGMQPSSIIRRLNERRKGKLALRKRELDTIYEQLREAVENAYPFITFQRPLAELWNRAEVYCAANIGATDAIHLATATGLACDVLVTRDEDFLVIAQQYMPTAQPEKAVKSLRELGFEIE